jgi:hypothetical protein
MFIVSFKPESPYNARGAKADLKKGNARILFPGGFGGMPDFNAEEDQLFQRKYGIDFFSQGCTRSGENENEAAYNQVVFAYLDKKFGKAWREELRPDAIGFEAPKTSRINKHIPLESNLAVQLRNPAAENRNTIGQSSKTSVWWYILPASALVLFLSVYVINKRRRK